MFVLIHLLILCFERQPQFVIVSAQYIQPAFLAVARGIDAPAAIRNGAAFAQAVAAFLPAATTSATIAAAAAAAELDDALYRTPLTVRADNRKN